MEESQNPVFRYLTPSEAREALSPAVARYAETHARAQSNRLDCIDGVWLVALSAGREVLLATDFRKSAAIVSDEPAHEREIVGEAANPADALAALIGAAAGADAEELEKTESEISRLEERLMTQEERQSAAGRLIVRHRRKLLIYKQRYEKIADLLDDVAELENGTTAAVLAVARRVERLLESVLNLRDYLTEVRDAYQSNVELRQNRIMQTFTVIAAIFMPLQLVTGWFGMNLIMPEAEWFWTYPIVCVGCVVLVGILLWVFHRKKWL